MVHRSDIELKPELCLALKLHIFHRWTVPLIYSYEFEVTSVLQPASLPSSITKRDKILFPRIQIREVYESHTPAEVIYLFFHGHGLINWLWKRTLGGLFAILSQNEGIIPALSAVVWCLNATCATMGECKWRTRTTSCGKVRMSAWKRYWRENGNATGCKLCGWQKLWRRWVHPSVRSSCYWTPLHTLIVDHSLQVNLQLCVGKSILWGLVSAAVKMNYVVCTFRFL